MNVGRLAGAALLVAMWACAGAAGQTAPLFGDVNGDGIVDARDIQFVINAVLGIPIPENYNPDVNHDDAVNALDIQHVINAVLGNAGGSARAWISGFVTTDDGVAMADARVRVFWKDFLLTETRADEAGAYALSAPADGSLLSLQASAPQAAKLEDFNPLTYTGHSTALDVLAPRPDAEYSLNFVLYEEAPLLNRQLGFELEEGMTRFHTPNHDVMLNDVPLDLGIAGGSARVFSPAQNPQAFPGEFLTREDGVEDMLISAGFVSVNLLREGPVGFLEPVNALVDESGDPVNVTLRFRIDRADWPSIQDGRNFSYLPSYTDMPDRLTTPLYIYDEIEGDWRLADNFGWLEDQNGPIPPEALTAINDQEYENDIYMVGEVNHFTFYNLDCPGPGACVTGVIRDQNGDPVENAKVTVYSMPAGTTGATFFSNVAEMITDASGRFGPTSEMWGLSWPRIPRSEQGPDDDWNGNDRVDTYKFYFTVEKKNLCGLEMMDNGGAGWTSPTFPAEDGCKDLGAFEVEVKEAKAKTYHITFVDSETGDPLHVPTQSPLEYATMRLNDPRIPLNSDTWKCACEADGGTCSNVSFTLESGRATVRIPVLDDKEDPWTTLSGLFRYKKMRPDLGEEGYEEATFPFPHKKDKSHYLSGDTVCSKTLSADQVVPPTDSDAVGMASFVMQAGGIVRMVVEHDVANVTGARIHTAPRGEEGSVLITLDHTSNPIEVDLSMAEFEAINAFPQYVIIESTAYPEGEIRGDLEFCSYTYRVDVTRKGDPTVEILTPASGASYLYDDMVTFEADGVDVRGASINDLNVFLWYAGSASSVFATGGTATAPAWQAFGAGPSQSVHVEGYDQYGYFGAASVTGITVASVSVTIPTPAAEVIATGGTLALDAAVTGANNTDVTWGSSDTSIATVSNAGVVTGVGAGTVTITATSAVDSSQSDAVELTVEPLAPSFDVTPGSGTTDDTFIFDASASEGAIASYMWDFGDGAQGSGETASHQYAAPGTYAVTLTVQGTGGASIASAPVNVTVVAPDDNVPPVASFAVTPQEGNPPLDVMVDASASADPDGEIVEYHWDFGDGAAGGGVTTAHTYTESGEYTITLTVTDNDGATGTATAGVRVNTPPVAAFTYDKSPVTGNVPADVTFNAAGSFDPDGEIVNYAWDFGDGAVDSGPNLTSPSHTYNTVDAFAVTLTVTDNEGLTGTASTTITTTDAAALTAQLTMEFLSGEPYATYRFDASGSSGPFGIESYTFTTGDGTSVESTQPEFTHRYTAPDTYTVTVTVEDSAGNTESDTLPIVVDHPDGELDNLQRVNRTDEGLDLFVDAATIISMSDDGRYVAFHSHTAPLEILKGEPGAKSGYELSGGPWIYVRDMETGDIHQVPSIAESQPSDVRLPVLSGDGNRVAYKGYDGQIHVYDFPSGEHFIASAAEDNGTMEPGNADAHHPSISQDGRYVAFHTQADNLMEDTPSGDNIFVTDLETGEVVHVGLGTQPQLTPDGQKVLLRGRIFFYLDDPSNAFQYILYDYNADSAILVTANEDGTADDGTVLSNSLSIIGDGEYVAFTSRSDNLVPEVPNNNVFQIYVKDTATGELAQFTDYEDGPCDDSSREPMGAGRGLFSEDLRMFFHQPDGFGEDCGQFGPFFDDLHLDDIDGAARAHVAPSVWGINPNYLFREIVMTPDGRYVAFRYNNLVFHAENPFWEE